ncbi:MAG: hypothetical protein IPN20_06095 [Haliscomenobacter sp.]|nr:hypothetical protein [Haliscomenobacter sp.]
MMKFKSLWIAGCLFCMGFIGQTQAQPVAFPKADQEQLKILEDTLALLSFLIINDSLEENRFGATRLMIPTLVKALKVKNSFDYPFERLKAVSIQYPPDSTFRVFTWQLYVAEDDYRYYGAIQMNTPELKLYPLIDRSFQVEEPEQAVLNPENWYGALYYGIQKLEHPQGPYYLMMGYDAFSFFKRRKLMEVLHFKEGKPVFGAAVIPDSSASAPMKKRLVLEYSAETTIRLNYDEALGVIVFDHLIPIAGRHGEGETLVPDGSYEAFRIGKGKLEYIPMLEFQPQLEAPRPSPVLDQKGKDIIGRTKKNGN